MKISDDSCELQTSQGFELIVHAGNVEKRKVRGVSNVCPQAKHAPGRRVIQAVAGAEVV